MSEEQPKKLLEWLAEVDQDQDVLREFREHGVEAAVKKAVAKGHDLPDHHKDTMKRNNCAEICGTLQEESEELRSGPGAGSVHQFWVLVRI